MARPSSAWMRRTSSHRRGRLERGEARHRLVEQQQARAGGQRAGDLEPLLVGQGEGRRRHVAPCRASPVNSSSSSARARARPIAVGALQRAADHVLEHRHAPEGPHDLPGARDAEAADPLGPRAGDVGAVEARSGPRRGGVQPLMQLKSVVLPAPLGPMRPDDLAAARWSSETSRLATSPPKRLVQPLDLQQRRHRVSPHRRGRRAAARRAEPAGPRQREQPVGPPAPRSA